MSKSITLLVGNIAAGKSTWVRENIDSNTVVVNDDRLVTMLHGGDYGLYQESNKKLYKDIEMSIIELALKSGKSVIVDRPNQKSKTRLRYINIARKYGAEVHFVQFKWETPKIHAIRRFGSDSRGRSIACWEKAAERINASRDLISDTEREKYDSITGFLSTSGDFRPSFLDLL
jgi:predicted kinase